MSNILFAIGIGLSVLFIWAIARFIIFVHTLHQIEEIQDCNEEILDNEFIDFSINKPKAIKREQYGGIAPKKNID